MYQTITIVGHLGGDPEMRYTPAGKAVTNFSVAVDASYNDAAGAAVKQTTWFRVAAWGKLAEACAAYLAKGKLVLVEGRVSARAYLREGVPVAALELTAGVVKFLSAREQPEEPPAGEAF